MLPCVARVYLLKALFWLFLTQTTKSVRTRPFVDGVDAVFVFSEAEFRERSALTIPTVLGVKTLGEVQGWNLAQDDRREQE